VNIMKIWRLLLFLSIAAVGVTSLSAENHTQSTALPIVFGPYSAIFNGDFEQGPIGWGSNHGGPPPVFQYPELGVRPVSGEWAARLTVDAFSITQGVVVPHDRPYLSYWRLVRRGEGECDPQEFAGVSVLLLSGGNPKFPVYATDVTNMCTDSEWEQRTINLSGVVGRPVEIGPFINSSNGAFFVDDFRFIAQPE
jgi:hypothetical protein